MAIDIRASITCNLGTLISASISDDYIQESGLIRTSGSCEISGLIVPKVGDVVTFSYTKNGITRNVPRKMRVLSSFADPFRRTTSVSLGCKLTYLQDLRDPVNWDAFDDELNADRTREEQEIVTIPIHASSIMNKCLLELGISASSNPLTNLFSISEFDFSAGYVDVLSDLLVSESYCGYLDFNEILQIFSLDQNGGSGPVISSDQIIDVGPINVGPLPGDAVTVSYSTLKLKQPEGGEPEGEEPDPEDDSGDRFQSWGSSSSINQYQVAINYDNVVTGASGAKIYNILETTEETTSYIQITDSEGKIKNVVSQRIKKETISSPAVIGSLFTQFLNIDVNPGGATYFKTTITKYRYDINGNETFQGSYTSGSEGYLYGGYGIPVAFSPDDYLETIGTLAVVKLGAVEINTIRNGDYAKTVTIIYSPWSETIGGQQALAEAGKNVTDAGQAADLLNSIPNILAQTNYNVSEERAGYSGQESPLKGDVVNQRNADESGDPDNGWRTQSKSELELASGSRAAQRRIEFSMPYAPDDVFYKFYNSYSAVRSDAPQKAKKYGIVQNRLLFGGRNGMNLQLPPERLPTAPFRPIIVYANSLSAMYRTNGMTWTMDASGIVASVDALFWGGLGTVS
jgi:hypothetical protein